VGAPDLHIGTVSSVTGIQLVIQNNAGQIVPHKFSLDSCESVATHFIKIAGRYGVLHRPMLAYGH
jgi:hypothetical protein